MSLIVFQALLASLNVENNKWNILKIYFVGQET